MGDAIVSVSATADGKTTFNTLDGVTAALPNAFSLSFNQNCPKPLIEQVVNWLLANTSKWPSNQVSFICAEPDFAPAEQTYNKYDARGWRARLSAAKPDWDSRETYAGAYGAMVSNGLFKPK